MRCSIQLSYKANSNSKTSSKRTAKILTLKHRANFKWNFREIRNPHRWLGFQVETFVFSNTDADPPSLRHLNRVGVLWGARAQGPNISPVRSMSMFISIDRLASSSILFRAVLRRRPYPHQQKKTRGEPLYLSSGSGSVLYNRSCSDTGTIPFGKPSFALIGWSRPLRSFHYAVRTAGLLRTWSSISCRNTR